MNRHEGVEWANVRAKLEANTGKLWSLSEMERTGGDPDVVGHDKKTGEYIFFDCSPETPEGRTNVCYDREALDARKEHKPKNSAVDMAATMGVELLTEEQYLELQKLGTFRHENVELAEIACQCSKARRRHFWRSALRSCLRVSQSVRSLTMPPGRSAAP